MAMDSQTKRSSAINVGTPWPMALPLADGSIDATDRAHISNVYGFESFPDSATGDVAIMGRGVSLKIGVGV